MTVRPERRCVAHYREGGHRKKDKAEDPEIGARRDDPIPTWLQDHLAVSSSTKKYSHLQAASKRPERQTSSTFSEDACWTSCNRSMRSAPPLVTVLSSVHSAREKRCGVGRRAQPVKTAGEQSRARHEPKGTWPVGLNNSIFLEISRARSRGLEDRRAADMLLYASTCK